MNKDEINRANIIEASKAVFRQYGYEKVTMNDIADAAGKGRSTLYYYFNNKYEVFEQVAIEEYSAILKPAEMQIKKSKSLSENLVLYNRCKLEQIEKKSNEYVHLLTDIKENKELIAKVIRIVAQKEIKLVKNMIVCAIESEDILPIEDDNLNFLALAIVTAISSLEKEMLLYGSIDNLSDKLYWLINLLVKGLK
ncbi:TetR/AcrR family transcriptional regulator [Flagellimonas aequoris]|uniref:TetR/AcrR family transcriptional regulator n=1 Tax=Flagellimonas aequoris TaxID=2306997 RepID=A0A418N6E4_9FLAO|nr:TetR/AcrR family transcriptional regulator [Allomuricauda aequoris]RIV70158.1 TetR/AcrR family transcriptional regulator [Allomuricauda aequoris]TXK01755.1 TetR/AcrR family transcriptional regulator [Allomuricauda aequoris]|tara:strand:- start:463 stop:1047 length:585 start_codon:yes stop_codon:yes gene_type:complete